MPEELGLRELSDERDRRYEAQFVAAAALWKAELDGHVRVDETRHDAAEAAAMKTDASVTRRLEVLNEQRAALNDYLLTTMPRAEIESRLVAFDEKLNGMSALVQLSQGRTGESDRRQSVSGIVPTVAISAVSVAVAIAAVIFAAVK